MLLEFKCRNYKSIKEEISLSMLATKDQEHEKTLFEVNGKRILPTSVIYGANGAGKTSIINAMKYMRFLIKNSQEFEPDRKIPMFTHKLNEVKNTSVEMQFIHEGTKFVYGFTVNSIEVVEEYLYHFKNNKQAKIFERKGLNYEYGKSYNKNLSEIEKIVGKSNKLFLSVAAIWGKIDDVTNAFNYFDKEICISSKLNEKGWLNLTLKKINEDMNFKKKFIVFLNRLDINVRDIEIVVDKEKGVNEQLLQILSDEAIMMLKNNNNNRVIVKEVILRYDNITINLEEESNGTKKLFELGGVILDVLMKGKILIYDEIETSLHAIIAETLISLFKDEYFNTNNAQLIFTTHDTNLLDLNMFRKDEIWFAEKNIKTFATDLYSLSDLKNIRQNENFEKGYIKGKYGAIPFINNNCMKDLRD